MNPETMFETAGSHESHYSNPYSNPELEWETESHYSNPELEWETESHYSNPEAEWETESHYSNPYSNPETEWETESHYSNPYSNPELEWETESHYSNPYSNPELEWEDEGEYFFKGLWKGIKKVGKTLAPLAKKFAPKIAGTLVSMIPGVGPALAPLASKAAGVLLREGEAEAESLEAQLFVSHEGELEVANTEIGQQLALTEFLAAQAAEAETEAEAEAAIAASLPITITIMGGRRALRPVVPILSQANARVVSALRRRGPAGSELLRLMPTVHRQTIGTLHAAARAGQPITAPVALKTLAHVTRRVLSNPRTVARAVDRNTFLKHRVASVTPRKRASHPGAPAYGRPASGGQTFRRPVTGNARPSRTVASAIRYR